LPLLNTDGGTERTVREAVAEIDNSSDVQGLIDRARSNRTPFRSSFDVPAYTTNVSILPRRFRLALEMSLHAADEQRAMDGELAELEVRWREAEEIAAIADSLLVNPVIEKKLGDLKR
jgi:hypothetical protein